MMHSSTPNDLDIFEIVKCYSVVEISAQKLSQHLEQVNFDPKIELEVPLLKDGSIEQRSEIVSPISTQESFEEIQNEDQSQKDEYLGEDKEQNEISKAVLDDYLKVLSQEIVSDEELTKLPSDDIINVYPYFMSSTVQMPNFDETPLGVFLLKKKEDKFENLPMYELQEKLDFTMMENKVLVIQNAVFSNFLKKNDPRCDLDKIRSFGSSNDGIYDSINFELATEKISRSKVVLPDVEECKSEEKYLKVLGLFMRVVEHEIKEAHREYELEQNRFQEKMKDFGAVQRSFKIHSDKMTETLDLLKELVVKKRKRKVSFDLHNFAEFLKVAVKQDQQDLRRLKVLKCKYDKTIREIKKVLKSHNSIHSVDLSLYEIKCKQLSAKLLEFNDEFLQLKKIFDSYQRRYEKTLTKLVEEDKRFSQNQKQRDVKIRALRVQRICYRMTLESTLELVDE